MIPLHRFCSPRQRHVDTEGPGNRHTGGHGGHGGRPRPASRFLAGSAAVIAGLVATLAAACGSYLPPLSLVPSPAPAQASRLAAVPVGDPREAPKPYYYPERPATLLVGAPRGSREESAARMLVPQLEHVLGQPVAVVPKPGGQGQEAWTLLRQARPDGYTLGLIASPAFQAIAMDSKRKATFAVADLLPLAGQVQEPGGILVRSSSPFKTVEDLIAAGRGAPGEVLVGISVGSLADAVAVADFQQKGDVRFREVPFMDEAGAITAVLGGQVDATFGSLPPMLSPARGGQGRVLAVILDQRHRDLPGVPTLRERKLEVASYSTLGFAFPRGTSGEIAEFLGWALYTALSNPGQQSQVANAGLSVRFADGRQYGAFLAAETERVKPLLSWIR